MSLFSVRDRKKKRWPRAALAAIAIAAAMWLGAFLRFIGHAATPPETAAPAGRAGIVVLTGTSDRLYRGLDLLRRGDGERLLISGVNPRMTKEGLRRAMGAEKDLFDCCIDLGDKARDTAGNAREAADWARRGGYDTLYIVTASYHMPRALLELQKLLPGMRLIPRPVDPPGLKLRRWWAWPRTAWVLSGEFNKYLFSLLKTSFQGSRQTHIR